MRTCRAFTHPLLRRALVILCVTVFCTSTLLYLPTMSVIPAILLGSITVGLVYIALFDQITMLVPNGVVYGCAGAFALWLVVTNDQQHAAGSLIGGGMALGLSLVIYVLFLLAQGRKSMGSGDVRLITLAGFCLGPQMLSPYLITAGMAGLVTILMRGAPLRRPVPFGPALCLSQLFWMLEHFQSRSW